jgi:hypothetical protein
VEFSEMTFVLFLCFSFSFIWNISLCCKYLENHTSVTLDIRAENQIYLQVNCI